ncbi:hypothetical protein CGCA056_v002935 [Colletotrichum aenigma]|uniref:uncharacterized protein n=1 Tax=Colletotrichum aenigma TaxID=1215731 RepID=UPI0018724458|nr:uncharacterized protein CGCA056_v002935 [Colletotrichum aenigma]KAF5526409.1 hypothetical protein CGCA056_v002935 [Colletotrichum aenigma]
MASTSRANSNHGKRTASWFKTSLCRRALTVRALEVKGKTSLVHSSKCRTYKAPPCEPQIRSSTPGASCLLVHVVSCNGCHEFGSLSRK